MSESQEPKLSERRDGDREELVRSVTVRLDQSDLVGPGQNISTRGVFFVTDRSLRVWVKIEGLEGELEGELVRVQAMAEGKTGVAIRFDAPVES